MKYKEKESGKSGVISKVVPRSSSFGPLGYNPAEAYLLKKIKKNFKVKKKSPYDQEKPSKGTELPTGGQEFKNFIQ